MFYLFILCNMMKALQFDDIIVLTFYFEELHVQKFLLTYFLLRISCNNTNIFHEDP